MGFIWVSCLSLISNLSVDRVLPKTLMTMMEIKKKKKWREYFTIKDKKGSYLASPAYKMYNRRIAEGGKSIHCSTCEKNVYRYKGEAGVVGGWAVAWAWARVRTKIKRMMIRCLGEEIASKTTIKFRLYQLAQSFRSQRYRTRSSLYLAAALQATCLCLWFGWRR